MIDFFSRLDNFMIFKGLNDNKITVECNISNGLIGKARKRGALSQDNISKILHKYPELDANWLLTGKGEMINSNSMHVGSKPTTIDEVIPKEELSALESLKQQLIEERERLRQAHKENGVLEFKLEQAQKEIARLKKGPENVVSRTQVPELKNK